MDTIEFIDGITVLYTKYYNNVAGKVLFIVLSSLCALLMVLTIIISIEDKDELKFTIPIGLATLSLAIVFFFISKDITPQTKYVVQINDTVPYAYIEKTFPKIHNEGGNVYYFYLDEE